MIELHLMNANGSDTLQLPEAPLTRNALEGATDVVSLNNNISTYFTANKREWVHTWAYMTKQELQTLQKYYQAQWTLFTYPKLSITGIDNPVNQVSVRMYMPSVSIIDDCETYRNIQVSWREK